MAVTRSIWDFGGFVCCLVMDLDLYEKMDGIETSRIIRNRFDVPVVYV